MTNDDLLLKLENSSKDKAFFSVNHNRLFHTYKYLDNILSNYIDICCHTFKTFKVNKTSYVYGSIVTLAAGIVLAKEKFFPRGFESESIEYLIRDVFPLFVDSYNTTTLVEAKTQSHMVRGYIDEFLKADNYIPGKIDSYLSKDVSIVVKKYLNQVVRYCVDHKIDGFTDKDVVEELLPFLKMISLDKVHIEYIFVHYDIDDVVMGFFPGIPELDVFKAKTNEELFDIAKESLIVYVKNNMTKLPIDTDEMDVYYRYDHHKEYRTIKFVEDID